MMQFLIAIKLLSSDWFLFSVLLANILGKEMKIIVSYTRPTNNEKIRKEYLAQQLNIPKNNCVGIWANFTILTFQSFLNYRIKEI